jgi:hypothetical protein
MANSARARESYQAVYEPIQYSATFSAAATGTTQVVAAKASHTAYIQSILVSVTTGAAQTYTFQDDSATKVLAKTKATSVQGDAYLYDFGPSGFPLTSAEGLDMVISGAGTAGAVHIEGYYKPNNAALHHP